jgi:uncharacterized protein involved in outer membrane biogenesis
MSDAPPPSPSRRPRRRFRILTWILLVIILVPLAAVGIFVGTFDPNAYRGRIAATLSQATGRQVTLAGPLSLALTPVPSLRVRDLRLGNLPGGSAPEMIQVAEIEASISPWPLLSHRIALTRLVLHQPRILLERVGGQPNWIFHPNPPAALPAPGNSSAATQPWHLSLRSLRLIDAGLVWHGAGSNESIDVADASVTSTADDGPITLRGAMRWHDVPVTLEGTAGPIDDLLAGSTSGKWPLDLTLSGAGAKANLQGSIADPMHATGYTLTLRAEIAALETLGPLLPPGVVAPGTSLPPLHGITISAMLDQDAKGAPRISRVATQAQASDLGTLLPGLKLDSLSLIAPAMDQPVTVNILGEREGFAFTVSGTLGAIAALRGPARSAYPLDLVLSAGQSNLHAQGTLAEPLALKGANVALSAQVANLSALSPLFATPLPAATALTGSANLADAPEGFAHGLALTRLSLNGPQGDLGGEIAVAYGTRTSVTATLRSTRLDLDALSAMGQPPVAPAAPPASPPAAQPAPSAMPAPAHAGPRRVIPDLPLPVAILRSFDGDLRLGFVSLKLGGVEYRALVTRVTLDHGKLALMPSSVVVPGGAMVAAGRLDASGSVPQVSLSAQAPNLALAPVLAALGLPGAGQGFGQVFASLNATGANTRALAASVSGPLGISVVNGVVDGQMLARVFAPAFKAARVLPPALLAAAGSLPLRCLALRLDSSAGHARVAAFVFDSSLLLLQGTGTIDLGSETLAIALNPELRLGRSDLKVPLSLGGSFAQPRISGGDVSVADQHTAGLNGLLQSLINGARSAPPTSGACAPALALARNGQPGPMPENNPGGGILGKPINLFEQLLHGQGG